MNTPPKDGPTIGTSYSVDLDPLFNLPPEIIQAAKTLTEWAEAGHHEYWQILGACDRRFLTRPPTMSGRTRTCPNPGCDKGQIDTGGFMPWGAPIYECCPVCEGWGKITPEKFGSWMLS